ncbi:serine hydrolase domain-containing protein [Sphingosinicella terrae]|uniref:serine hydrolase domain-containing protein n=1 Tax=Sphingosinicella terrae TaxID=2172047 RepID=UPI0013B3EEC9|nr:serine hydrolase domain-containing protein [Sphingosinicella terrae]
MGYSDATNFSFLQRNLAETRAYCDDRMAQGFRVKSISVAGENPVSGTIDARYSVVLTKGRIWTDQEVVFGKSQAQFQTIFEQMAAKGFGPTIVAAGGGKDRAVFAGAFRPMPTIPLTRINMSEQNFGDINHEQRQQGNLLVWADCFGTLGDRRYCAIWGANPDRIAWNLDVIDAVGDLRQQRFDAMVSQRARPAHVSISPSGGVLHLYRDSRIGRWTMRSLMTFGETTDYRTEKKADGLWPIRIASSGQGDNARFAMICAEGETRMERGLRTVGRDTSGTTTHTQAIDQAMKRLLQTQNLRGLALAIVQGTRLVFARGYTFAESDYPNVLETTLFRQASVSKALSAIAIWRLIQQGGSNGLALGTIMQSVLSLRTGRGNAPGDFRFAMITLQHLLESCSGIPQDVVRETLSEWRSRGPSAWQPAPHRAIHEGIAEQALTGTPGDRDITDYGRTDYYLLGRIAARRLGVDSFEDAFRRLVMQPLGMIRTRTSSSAADDQPDDETRYHTTAADDALWLTRSQVHSDRRYVPVQYGGWNMDVFSSAGGMSASVVDMARLCAMLGSRNAANPVLTPATIDRMMRRAVTAGADQPDPAPNNNKRHGYHGFDWVSNVGTTRNPAFEYSKGGSFEAARAGIRGTTGGRGLAYAIAYNGDPDGPSADRDWYGQISAAAQANAWGNGDLFPFYGMAPLP